MQWLAWTVVMGQAWMFVKLASLRGDALLCSPRATPGQHLRILALLGGILAQVGLGMGGWGVGARAWCATWMCTAAVPCTPRLSPGSHARVATPVCPLQDVSWIAGYIGSGMSAGSLRCAAAPPAAGNEGARGA